MKNYIMFNGNKIAITESQIAEIKKCLGFCNTELSEIEPGEPFKIGEYEFFVLEHLENGTAVMLKDFLKDDETFGGSNNYDGSNVDKKCIDFGNKIASLVGKDNLIEHTVDLTADDGLKDYGTINRKMSLLTANLYRKYVELIDLHKIDKWWWLATALSTPKHKIEYSVKCVSPGGYFNSNRYCNNGGVRPFCILKSNIFVSK